MRATTQAARLQVKAPREQLEVRKALRQFVVTVLRLAAVSDGKRAFASHTAGLDHAHNGAHFLVSCKMGAILQKLFGGSGPVVESNLDTQGSCTSKCCDTDVVSEISSSSSECTHASHHVQSRTSFETLPPCGAELSTK